MSPIIEVLIGMVFLYSLLSILVTQINSVISQMLNLRAKHLRGAIDELIQDPEIRAKIIAHPLIQLAKEKVLPEQRLEDSQIEKILTGDLRKLSWIDPHTFVSVLMDVLRVDSDKELFGALLNIIDDMPAGEERRRLRATIHKIMSTGEGFDDLRNLVENLSDPTYCKALTKSLNEIEEEISGMGLENSNIIALMAGLRQVNNPYLRSAMQAILSTSKTLEEAEHTLAGWFNEGMSRATEAFKATMQYWSLFIGFLLAIFLNVDSLHIARTLWNDPALRQSVAQAAETVDLETLQNRFEDARTAQDDTVDTDGDGDTADETGGFDDVTDAANAATLTLNNILELRLPLGWKLEPAPDNAPDSSRYLQNMLPWQNPDNWLQMLLIKLGGIAITMIAIAQGAPFWFGFLQKLSGGSAN
jgi:hypothetical protein